MYYYLVLMRQYLECDKYKKKYEVEVEKNKELEEQLERFKLLIQELKNL